MNTDKYIDKPKAITMSENKKCILCYDGKFHSYLNEIYVITREVKDKVTNAILTTADYSDLGILLITVTLITLIIPIVFVVIIQKTKFKTSE